MMGNDQAMSYKKRNLKSYTCSTLVNYKIICNDYITLETNDEM